MPYFSIILPTYNRAHLLSKAIESVLAQTFTDWELLIVDDGSTDNTKELVMAYSDERIRYIYQENQERSAARNNGINHAFGTYICFLDSDDYYLDKKLENLFHYIEKTENKKCLFYDGVLLDIEGIRENQNFPIKKNQETFHEFILTHIFFSLQICGQIEIFRHFNFNSSIRIGEDIELWCRIVKSYSIFPVPDSFQSVIVEHDERSINPKKTKAAIEHLSTLRHIFKENSFKDISYNVRSKLKSASYFNIAKHEMLNNRKTRAFFWTMYSILKNINNPQTKHKIYCLSILLSRRLPNEYKL